MAVPAHLAALGLLLHIAHATSFYEFRVQLRVAADTVVHHHLSCQCLGLDGLMLHVTYKINCVLHAVQSLKTIVNGCVLMGYMTVIARCTILLVIDTSVR